MKRKIMLSLILTLVFNVSVFAGQTIVFVDNQSISSEYNPEIVDGVTFLPIRVIAETLGYNVYFNPETKVINVDGLFTHKVGTSYVTLADGEVIDIGVNSYIKDGRTYVSVRLFSEALGYDVNYDENTKNIWIDTHKYDKGDVVSPVDTTPRYITTISGKNTELNDKKYNFDEDNETALLIKDNAVVNADKLNVNKSGDSTNLDESLENGRNSAIIVDNGSKLISNHADVVTNGSGSNGIFINDNSSVSLSNFKITTNGKNSFGIVSNESSINLNSVDINTNQQNSSGIVLSDNSKNVLTKGTIKTAGSNSSAINIKGDNKIYNFDILSTLSSPIILNDNSNTVLNNTNIKSENNSLIYVKGAEEINLTVSGGKLDSGYNDFIYQEDGQLNLILDNVDINSRNNFIEIESTDSKATSANVTCKNQILAGDVNVGDNTTVTLNLQSGSTYMGSINHDRNGGEVTLDMDVSSTWDMTKNSYVHVINPTTQSYAGINSNGYYIYYDATNPENYWLNQKSYMLSGGGKITPMKNN